MPSGRAIATVVMLMPLVLVGCGHGSSRSETDTRRPLPAVSRCERTGPERTLVRLESGLARMKVRFHTALHGHKEAASGEARHQVRSLEASLRALRKEVARCSPGASDSEVTRAIRVYGRPVCERIGMERSLEGLEAGAEGIGRLFRAALAGRKKILPEGVHPGEPDHGAAHPFPIPPESVRATGETVLEVMVGNTEGLRGDIEACEE